MDLASLPNITKSLPLKKKERKEKETRPWVSHQQHEATKRNQRAPSSGRHCPHRSCCQPQVLPPPPRARRSECWVRDTKPSTMGIAALAASRQRCLPAWTIRSPKKGFRKSKVIQGKKQIWRDRQLPAGVLGR